MPKGAVTIKIDDREFKRALRQIIATDKKEMPYVLNDQAYRLAQAAMNFTKKATPASINKLKRLKARDWKKPKNPRPHKRDDIKSGAFAFYNAWRKRHGGAIGRASYEDVEKHINARKISIGWVKSQWLRAMASVSTSGKGLNKARGVKKVPPIHKLGGWGQKAKPAINPFAYIGVKMDEEGSITGKISGKLSGILMAGLRAAIPARVIDMKKKLEQRLARVHKKHSAR